MMEAALGISVFLDDPATYDVALSKFLARVPAYIYLRSDGAYPRTVPSDKLDTKAKVVKYWFDQATFPEDGMVQETCRDFWHVGYGIASISHVAETVRIQGGDLYGGDVGRRLRFALGFHAKYQLGEKVPGWLCGGRVKRGLNAGALGGSSPFLFLVVAFLSLWLLLC